ncbi:MAG: hypothetical protein PHX93_05775 [Candidatus Peribacteraceae bacterium]|jgi:hypothetical protein|nr:hypothetical protein [Candidatus Peribacteraceae bacterium]
MPTNTKERSLTFTVGLFTMIAKSKPKVKEHIQKTEQQTQTVQKQTKYRKRADVPAIEEGETMHRDKSMRILEY